MYVIGFILGYLIIKKRKILSEDKLDTLLFYLFLWIILGGRLGYVLFYNLPYYIAHPIDILKTWQGGMAFHWGVIGAVIAMFLFAKKNKEDLYTIADHVTSVLPIGLWLGRIGNYLNKELLGMAYNWPLAVIAKNGKSYFPSPLLEAFLEGIVLWFILLYIYKNRTIPGQVAGAFLFFYWIFRFLIEFIRTPDIQLWYLAFGWITMGQLLSIPLIFIGLYFWKIRIKNIKIIPISENI